jgi:hypothetical protein
LEDIFPPFSSGWLPPPCTSCALLRLGLCDFMLTPSRSLRLSMPLPPWLLVYAISWFGWPPTNPRDGCLGRQDAMGNYRDLFLMLRVQLFRGVSGSCLGGGGSWAWAKALQGLGQYGGSAAPPLGDLSFKRPHSESQVMRISTLLR